MAKSVLNLPKKVKALVSGECNLSFSCGRVEVKKFKKDEEFLVSPGAYAQLIAAKKVEDVKEVAAAPANKDGEPARSDKSLKNGFKNK